MEKYNFSKISTSLQDKGYKVSIFDSKEEAVKYLDAEIDKKSVGIGGSVTVNQLGLYDVLEKHNEIFWHGKKSDMSPREIMGLAGRSQVYISSVNAISEDGYIVNIDGTGNRVAAISYGPEKIYLLVGKNKIEEDLDKAIFRARNVAGPLNAKRLNKKTPCAIKADKCYDCKSPERICRSFSILACKPTGADYEIVLINEDLGF